MKTPKASSLPSPAPKTPNSPSSATQATDDLPTVHHPSRSPVVESIQSPATIARPAPPPKIASSDDSQHLRLRYASILGATILILLFFWTNTAARRALASWTLNIRYFILSKFETPPESSKVIVVRIDDKIGRAHV